MVECQTKMAANTLFSPLKIGNVAFANRIALAPMSQGGGGPNGCVTEAVLNHYEKRARAGTGMIIVEGTSVGPDDRGFLCAYNEQHTQGLATLAKRIHAHGSVACLQLFHGGPYKNPKGTTSPPVAPSDKEKSQALKMLDQEDLQKIQQDFTHSAALAIDVGFDAVEVHACFGILDAFLYSRDNKREDNYGGSIENRMRLVIETCNKVKDRIGGRGLVSNRVSIWDKIELDGLTSEELTRMIKKYKEVKLDMLHIATKDAFSTLFDTGETTGNILKKHLSLPIIMAGKLGKPEDANRFILEGHGDIAAIGNAMLADPEWSQKAKKAFYG